MIIIDGFLYLTNSQIGMFIFVFIFLLFAFFMSKKDLSDGLAIDLTIFISTILISIVFIFLIVQGVLNNHFYAKEFNKFYNDNALEVALTDIKTNDDFFIIHLSDKGFKFKKDLDEVYYIAEAPDRHSHFIVKTSDKELKEYMRKNKDMLLTEDGLIKKIGE